MRTKEAGSDHFVDYSNPVTPRSWNKPNFEGRCCAYCGAGRAKLHPGETMASLKVKLASDGHVAKEFSDYTDALTEHYKSGNATSHTFTGPSERIVKEQTNSFKAGVKGVYKLLSSYAFGDPATNGLGHTQTRIKWKDGVVRPRRATQYHC
eukprot:3532270-Pyramimonas_sp.AAC.2